MRISVDYAKYQAMAKPINMDLTQGAVAIMDSGVGLLDIAVQLSKAIKEQRW